MNGEAIKCEIKVSKHGGFALVGIVRDVTERYRAFDAERRMHEEVLARQKDAQAVNRFTRHEVRSALWKPRNTYLDSL